MFQRIISPLVIFEERTDDDKLYTQGVLPLTIQFRNDMFGNNWTFQQDGGRPHIHQKLKVGVGLIYHLSLTKNVDLNPRDYCIWDEFAGWLGGGGYQLATDDI